MPQKRVFRSRSQMLVGIGGGVFFAALAVDVALHARTTTSAIAIGVLLGSIDLLIIAIFARVAVVADNGGVTVRNPLSRRVLRWSEIKGFRIGRAGVLSRVCLIELRDGTTQYAFGIQVPNGSSTSQSREAGDVAQLNGLLARYS